MKQKSIVIASCLVANFPQAHEKGTSRRERKRERQARNVWLRVFVCEWRKKRNLIEFLKSMSKL